MQKSENDKPLSGVAWLERETDAGEKNGVSVLPTAADLSALFSLSDASENCYNVCTDALQENRDRDWEEQLVEQSEYMRHPGTCIPFEADVYVDGDCYSLVTVQAYAVFQYQETPFKSDPQPLYFLLPKLTPGLGVGAISSKRFAELLEAQQFGRFLDYRWPLATSGTLKLFLRPDGTGFFSEPGDHVEFVWRPEMVGLRSYAIVLDVPDWMLQLLCEQVLTEQIMPCMASPFISPDIRPPEQPPAFACGSETLLKRVARWILHMESELFQENKTVRVQFFSQDGDEQYNPTRIYAPASNRARFLINLAFEANRLTGWQCQPGFSEFITGGAAISGRR